MPPPSPLTVSTSAVLRLIKEESYYHSELARQKSKIAQLEANPGDDDNAEWNIKQQKAALGETVAVFTPLYKKIGDAVARLEEQIAFKEREQPGELPEELEKAREAVRKGKEVVEKGSKEGKKEDGGDREEI